MRRALLGLACWLLSTTALAAQEPPSGAPSNPAGEAAASAGDIPATGQVVLELEPRQITVGDRVEATVRLLWEGPEPSAAPRFPAWQETWGGAEVLSAGEVEAFVDQSGRRVYQQPLTLTAFRPGEVELPPMAIAVPVGERTIEVAVPGDRGFEVTSVLPQDGAEEALEPRPPAGLQQPSSEPRFWIALLLLTALCALAFWRLRRRLGDADIAAILRPATPRLEPLPELLDRLRRLAPSLGCEPVHTGLSFALRDYLGRRLAFPALESTTSEIQRHLRQSPVPIEVYRQALELLRCCDQVKFARLRVGDAEVERRLNKAAELAEQIEQAMRPAQPAEEAA